MIRDQYRTVELPARPDARLMASICRWKDCVSIVIVVFTLRIILWPRSSDNPLPDILRLDGILLSSLRQRVRRPFFPTIRFLVVPVVGLIFS